MTSKVASLLPRCPGIHLTFESLLQLNHWVLHLVVVTCQLGENH